MAEKIAWWTLYTCTLVVHYSWILWASWLIDKFFHIREFTFQALVAMCIWLVIIVISSGCPFTYLEQHIEVRLGQRSEVTYTIDQSIGYRYFIGPAKKIVQGWVK